jgi:hypothetical protein
MPNKAKASSIDPIPAYLLAKLALAEKCRGDKVQMWGTQLLLGAFRQVLAASESGGGRLLVVDADNEALVPWYADHGFCAGATGGRGSTEVPKGTRNDIRRPPSSSEAVR